MSHSWSWLASRGHDSWPDSWFGGWRSKYYNFCSERFVLFLTPLSNPGCLQPPHSCSVVEVVLGVLLEQDGVPDCPPEGQEGESAGIGLVLVLVVVLLYLVLVRSLLFVLWLVLVLRLGWSCYWWPVFTVLVMGAHEKYGKSWVLGRVLNFVFHLFTNWHFDILYFVYKHKISRFMFSK